MTAQSSPEADQDRLWNELVLLRDAWTQYTILFGGTAERVAMLNTCAGWFFGTTQRLLLREVILGVSRLTDPSELGKHANLTVRILLVDPAVDSVAGLREELSALVQKAVDAAKDLRVHRSKFIAHLDHATALGSPESPLPGLPRQAVEDAVATLEAAFSLHSTRVRHRDRSFRLASLGGADALVGILEKSERWKDHQDLIARGHVVAPAPRSQL